MKNNEPLVSIIVRTKDRPSLLYDALESISNQTYQNIHVVVVNDGGKDVSSVITQFKDSFKAIDYIPLPINTGRSNAANIGINAAQGQFVAFLDDDDLYLANAIKDLVEHSANTGFQVVYGKVILKFYKSDKQVDITRPEQVYDSPFSRNLLLLVNYIPFNALLFDRKIFTQFGLFDSSLEVYEDWHFLLRISKKIPFSFMDKQIAIYRSFGSTTGEGTRFTSDILEKTLDIIRTSVWNEITPLTITEYSTYLQKQFDVFMAAANKEIYNYRKYLDASEKECIVLKKFLQDSEIERENLKSFLAASEDIRKNLEMKTKKLTHLLQKTQVEYLGLQNLLIMKIWNFLKKIFA